MDIKYVNGILDRIKEIISDNHAGEIEKDIVLDKLRELYGYIKFQEADNLQPEIKMDESVDSPTAGDEGESGELRDRNERRAALEAMMNEEIFINTEQFCKSDFSTRFRVENVVDRTSEVVPVESFSDESAEPQPEQCGQKIDKKKLLSLYGNDSAAETEVHEEVPAQAQTQHPMEQPVFEAPVDHATSGTILADTLHNGEKTISESYSAVNSHDVADKLSRESVTELKKSIGINDKFLMVRDLFGGDNDQFDKCITALEQFSDLDDALLFIHENYRWNPDSDGASMLVELLTRKLS